MLSAGVVAAAGISYVSQNLDEGSKRSIQFWRRVFPIYIHYRFYQLLDRDLGLLSDSYADKKFEDLHELYTDTVKDIVYSMRGFYLKNCQLLSTQVRLVLLLRGNLTTIFNKTCLLHVQRLGRFRSESLHEMVEGHARQRPQRLHEQCRGQGVLQANAARGVGTRFRRGLLILGG